MGTDIRETTSELLWKELVTLPLGTRTSVFELAKMSDGLEGYLEDSFRLAETDNVHHIDEVDDVVEILCEKAAEEGFFLQDDLEDHLVLRAFAEPGRRIDFSEVEEMTFETYSYANAVPYAKVSFSDGIIRLYADTAGVVGQHDSRAVAADVEQALTQLFDEHAVSSWKSTYEPEGHPVLDGDSWHLAVLFKDGTVFISQGMNEYPDAFTPFKTKLLALFQH